ncbi:hypothetical protein C4544_06915 [candidate division WS5 bacterium]|uniref:Uncharacterized protein n=1 Tax=candidate division WS5 bacterium TaxID=2093353 RepID=A0A419DAD2_9BACT|nr:MAG: hypothetical protein C4544_06915 [candidate division WS5 bacterium]
MAVNPELVDAVLNTRREDWKESKEGWKCKICGSPAYIHPDNTGIWGCMECQMFSFHPSNCFIQKRDKIISRIEPLHKAP